MEQSKGMTPPNVTQGGAGFGWHFPWSVQQGWRHAHDLRAP